MPQQHSSQIATGRKPGAIGAATPGGARVIAVGRDTPVLGIFSWSQPSK